MSIFAKRTLYRIALVQLIRLISSERFIREDQENRNYLGVFTIVKFSNDACQGSASNSVGQCLAYADCYMSGGYGDGSCAEGFGVCCLFFTSSCGSTINQNITYLQNPGYPSGYSTAVSTQCEYRITKCESSVCQVRIDFESLQLQNAVRTSVPATNQAGTCVVDKLDFSTTSGDKFGSICGTETDNSQHLYLDLGYDSNDYATLVFQTNAAAPTSTASRYWSMLITQIPCAKGMLQTADPGCRQYLTGVTGSLQSFNFANTNNPQLLAGSYTSCIRREAGYCTICYQASTDTNSFQTDSSPGIATGGSGTTSCPANIARLWIPDSNVGGDRSLATRDVYCGGALLPAYVCSLTSNKVTTQFVSPANNIAAGGTGDTMKGFKIIFRQIPCSS